MEKSQRLAEFLTRMDAAPPAGNTSEGYELIATTLNQVEDTYTSILPNPSQWMTDGRMYPPMQDSRRPHCHGVVRYRSAKQNTYIADNGAIRICDISGAVRLDKHGFDGRKVSDYEN